MFLHPGAKLAKKVDISNALFDTIASTHGEQTAATIVPAARIFQRLRSAIHEPPTTELTHTGLQKYYRAVTYILDDLKFDFQLSVPLLWVNAFDASSDASVPHLSFDRVSVLFNLAVNESALALASYRHRSTKSDALPTVAKHFQLAAGYFATVRSHPPPGGMLNTTPDLFPPAVIALEYVMLANAQQAFYLHCRSTNVSNALLSRLAAGVSDFYSIAAESASEPDLRSTPFYSLVALPCTALHKYFHAISLQDAASAASDRSSVPDMLAILPIAVKAAEAVIPLAREAASSSTSLAAISDLCEQISRTSSELLSSLTDQLQEVEDDNRRIYFSSPSDNPKLPRPHRSVKTADVSVILDKLQIDQGLLLFSSLPPPPTEESTGVASRYEDMAASLVASEVAAVHSAASAASHAASTASSTISASRTRAAAARRSRAGSQPTALTTEENEAVQALRDVVSRGGGRAVRDLQAQVVSAAGIARTDIDCILKLLDEEALQDRSLQAVFPGHRPNSPSRTTGYYERIGKLKRNLEQAANADAVIAADVDKHHDGMEAILRVNIQAIIDKRLRGEGRIENQSHPVTDSEVERVSARVAALKSVLHDVLQRRDEVVQELEKKKQLDNTMTATARIKEGDNEIEQFLDLLDKTYGEVKRNARNLCRELNEIRAELTSLTESLSEGDLNNGDDHDSDGNDGMMEIYRHQPAALKFHETMRNLAQGMQFYSKEQENIVMLKHDVEGFVKARDTEYKDIMVKQNNHSHQHPNYSQARPPGNGGSGLYPGGPSSGYSPAFGGWGNASGNAGGGGGPKWGRY